MWAQRVFHFIVDIDAVGSVEAEMKHREGGERLSFETLRGN